jgi:hypothetical protein
MTSQEAHILGCRWNGSEELLGGNGEWYIEATVFKVGSAWFRHRRAILRKTDIDIEKAVQVGNQT